MSFTVQAIVGADAYPLPDWTSLQLGLANSDVSSLQGDYPLVGRNYDKLREGAILVVLQNGVEIRDGRFSVQAGQLKDSVAGDVQTFFAKSVLDAFRRAVTVGRPSKADSIQFNSKTVGYVLRTLLQQAQSRGALSGITWKFTDDVDSSGNKWTFNWSVIYKAGVRYDEILRNLVDAGICRLSTSGTELVVLDGAGQTDAPAVTAATLVAGRDYSETPSKWTAENRARYALVIGDEGAAADYEDTEAPLGPFGREEISLSQGGVSDAGSLAAVTQLNLQQVSRTQYQYTRQLKLIDGMPVPGVDYRCGDWVSEWLDGKLTPYRVQAIALTLGKSGKLDTVALTLNDRLLERDIRLNRKVDGILSSVGQNTARPPGTEPQKPDTLAPAAPTGLATNTSTYVDQAGVTYSAAAFSWNAVTTNANGTPATDVDHYEYRWKSGASIRRGAPASLTPGRPNTLLNSLWDRRGKGWGWIGGDGANSARLPSGKDLWVFSDTALGQASSAGKIMTQNGWSMVNNSFVMTDPGDPTLFDTKYGMANLLSAPLADCGSSGTASALWTAINGSVAFDTAWAGYGSSSLKLTMTDAGGASVSAAEHNGCFEKFNYTFRATARTAASLQVGLRVSWFNSSGASVGVTDGPLVQVSAGNPADLVAVLQSPAGAKTFRVGVRTSGGAAGQPLWLDRFGAVGGDRTYQAWSVTRPGYAYESLVSPSTFGVVPASGYKYDDYWCWVGDSWLSSGKLFVTVMTLRRNTSGGTDYANLPGTRVAWWDANTLAYGGYYELPTGSIVFSDCAWVEGDGYCYLLGHTSETTEKQYLARVPVSNPSTVTFRTATGWSASASDATTQIKHPVGSIRKFGSTYSAYYINGFDANIRRCTAPSILGPWTDDPAVVYRTPEYGSGNYVYIARQHPQFDSVDGAVFGYSQNTLNDWTADISHSGPRFAWGPPASWTSADLSGENVPWEGYASTGLTSGYASRITPTSTVLVDVRAVDRSGNASGWTRSVVVAAANAAAPATPSKPRVVPTFQGLQVSWDGLTAAGSLAPRSWRYVEVHVSPVADFVPVAETLVGTLPGPATWPVSGLLAGATYYAKLVALDANGLRSEASLADSASTNQLVNADLPEKLVKAANVADGAITVKQIDVAAWSDSLIPNPDFEAGFSGGIPDGWNRAWGDQIPQEVTGASSIQGAKSFKVTATAGNVEMWRSASVPVVGGNTYYFSATVKVHSDIGSGGQVYAYLATGATPAECDGWHGQLTASTPASSVTKAGTYTFVGQGMASVESKYIALMLVVRGDSSNPATATWGGTEFKKIVGAANLANASIGNAQISFLDLNAGNVGKLRVDNLIAGELKADVTLSSQIRTATSGARITIDSTKGVLGYNSSGNVVTELHTSDGGLVSRYLRTNTSGTRLEMGTYSNGAGSANIAFFPDSNNWLFPPSMGYGGAYTNNWVPGVSMQSGSLSSTNYNKYGLSQIGLDQVGGVVITTGNLLNGSSASTGSNISLDANGSTGSVLLRSGGSGGQDDRATLRLGPTYGSSYLALPGGYLSWDGPVSQTNRLSQSNAAWGGFDAYHMVWNLYHGIRFSSGGSSNSDIFSVSSSGLIKGNGDWGTPKIATRNANDDWIQWNSSGDAYVNGRQVKTFVIDHPDDPQRLLVHATVEMPQARVEYAGTTTVTGEASYVVLPSYYESLTHAGSDVVTLQLHPCQVHGIHCEGVARVSRVDGDRFWVLLVGGGPSCAPEASWRVSAVRSDVDQFDVEPVRSSGKIAGDGPYTYFVPTKETRHG